MASDGTRVFILGGISSVGAQVGEITLSHVFDTSTYLSSVISDGQPLSLETQSTLNTRNPHPSLLISLKNRTALLPCRLLVKVRPGPVCNA